MDEPSEAAIAEVCEFASLDPVSDRQLVISALKAKAGSVQDVVLAYYDDQAKFRQTYAWDESAFLSDRDNAYDRPFLPSFNVVGPDEGPVIHGVAPAAYHSMPPSRPPSRAQSPLSRIADWTSSNLGAASSTLTQEEKDLEAALAESAAMSGIYVPPPQETGIMAQGERNAAPVAAAHPASAMASASTPASAYGALPFFGPANRDAYDPDQWAMVPKAREPQEPGPGDRRRAPGTPAFLRCRRLGNNNTCTLGALLTVLHAIPAARNALLRAGYPAPTYGQNPEWWKGVLIEPIGELDMSAAPHPLAHGDTDMAAVTPLPADHTAAREFLEEIHRLMAFLDGTDRAYGTADNFKATFLVKDAMDPDTAKVFFQILQRFQLADVAQAFFTEVQMMRIEQLAFPLCADAYAMLDVMVDCRDFVGIPPSNLYHAMDSVYWADLYKREAADLVDPKMAVISRLAPVQVFRLQIDNLPGPGFDVPADFYVDRYLTENREWALRTQKQIYSVQQTLIEMQQARRKVLLYEDRSADGTITARDTVTLSEQALQFAMQKLWHYKAHLFWARTQSAGAGGVDFNLAEVDNVTPETDSERAVFQALQAEIVVHRYALEKIERKLRSLDAQRDVLLQLDARLRSKGSRPEPGESGQSDSYHVTHPIRLRGVVTGADKFYVCRREEAEPATPEGADAPSVSKDQWWKVSYNTYDPEPISVQKATVDDARQAAFKETNAPILIYCNDAAWNEAKDPLSDALRTFVRFDNRFFKQEGMGDSSRERKRQPADDASSTSPLKRQQRSSSIDSLASNRASLGAMSDRDMEDVPLLSVEAEDTDAFELQNRSINDATAAWEAGHAGLASDWLPGKSMENAQSTHVEDITHPYPSGYDQSPLRPLLAGEMVQRGASSQEGRRPEDEAQAAAAGTGASVGASASTASSAGAAGSLSLDDASSGSTTDQHESTGSGEPGSRTTNSSPGSQGQMREGTPVMVKVRSDRDAAATEPGGGPRLIADWDNPEGRYVEPLEQRTAGDRT